ncbi:MAG: hypothetical protein ABGX16_00620 [Pirellulales bacterium]
MKRTIFSGLTLAAIMALLWALPVSGAIIASYDFAGGSGLSADTDALTTAGAYDPRSSAVGGDDSGISGSTFTAYMRAQNTPNTSNPATSNFYHTFKITVDTGFLNLTSISHDYGVTNPYTGFNFFDGVYTNLTGLTGTGDKLGGADLFNATGPTTNNIDLSGIPALQGLAAGQSVEFRIYFGDPSTSNDRIHRVDNLVVNGVTFIPEPTTLLIWSLLAGLGVGLGWLRRK